MQLARDLHAGGWKPTAIRRLLGEAGHEQPSVYTIHQWTNPTYKERQLAQHRRRDAERTAAQSDFRWPNSRSTTWRLRRMETLRGLGLSYVAVAKVMSHDFPDAPVTCHEVERALELQRPPQSWRVAA